MRRARRALGAIVALVLGACTAERGAVRSYLGAGIPVETLDRHVEERMHALGIPGLSIVFLDGGEVVHRRVLGHANVQDRRPVTDTTIFEAASLSKPVFAYFAMTYVDDGRLDLDRPLHEYLPYPDIAHDARYTRITARMVLSHRSGFPNWRTDYPDSALFLAFEPGTDYRYSGEGYQYLALVLKAIEGTTWAGLDSAFRARVTEPLGMTRTVFLQDAVSAANKAEPYGRDGAWTRIRTTIRTASCGSSSARPRRCTRKPVTSPGG